MGILNCASSKSVYRGYQYVKKVMSYHVIKYHIMSMREKLKEQI